MQTCVYDFLGIRTDPLYQTIQELKKGKSVVISEIVVSLTVFNRYEIVSNYSHEAYHTVFEAYKGLIDVMNGIS